MAETKPSEWRELALAVQNESNPENLLMLVGRLCEALDHENQRKPQAPGRARQQERNEDGKA